jgi:methyltransferase (TIGR00027 family)
MEPVSRTAFYCCGVRMEDAESRAPICNDTYARPFMSDEGLRIYAPFRSEKYPNASNVARHRIIDDILRKALAADRELQVVIVGAGFDSRAYRLDGGRWVELDEPAILAYKDACLPSARCRNPLSRVPIEFARESLAAKLAPFATDRATVVVVEGVFMYLDAQAIRALLDALRRTFPAHTLVCDLMSRRFFQKYARSVHAKLAGLGAAFIVADAPLDLVAGCGYRMVDRVSIVDRAVDYRAIRMPKIVLRLFAPSVLDGYSLCTFVPR